MIAKERESGSAQCGGPRNTERIRNNMERKMLCKIDFENRQELLPLTYKLKMLVRRAVETTLDYEQYENPIEVSVTFTDNEGIRDLNLKFLNIDRSTDVLSFPLFDYTGVRSRRWTSLWGCSAIS